MSTECPFCNYSGPSEIIAEYDDTIVFAPINPVTLGHVLVVPKVHVVDAAENPRITASAYYDAAREAQRLLGPFNLITSAGQAATQTVQHLHIHLVPRRFGDGLLLPWSDQSCITHQGHEAYDNRISYGEFERILLALGRSVADSRESWPRPKNEDDHAEFEKGRGVSAPTDSLFPALDTRRSDRDV